MNGKNGDNATDGGVGKFNFMNFNKHIINQLLR
jgi:hypothetical protein